MSSTDRDLVDALAQVSLVVTAELSQLASARHLSLTQLRVLGVLRDREPRMSELAGHLGLDRSTISGLVDRAAERGLLERYADPDDRRSSRVRLTAEGAALARETEGLAAERIARALPGLDGLPQDRRERLVGLLEQALDGHQE